MDRLHKRDWNWRSDELSEFSRRGVKARLRHAPVFRRE